jgi:tetratricopeptide (TPR) repeat protein
MIRRLAAEFDSIRLIAPTFGEAYSMSGQMRRLLGDQASGKALLRTAMRLTAYDGVAILFNAEDAMAQGQIDEGKRLYARAAMLMAIPHERVIDRMIHQYQRPDDALEFAGDAEHLLYYAQQALERAGHAELSTEATRRIEANIRQRAALPDARPETLHAMSRLLRRDGNMPESLRLLRGAVLRRPDQPDWRLELARELQASGDFTGALEHAEAALRYRPGWEEAMLLIAEVRDRAGG